MGSLNVDDRLDALEAAVAELRDALASVAGTLLDAYAVVADTPPPTPRPKKTTKA